MHPNNIPSKRIAIDFDGVLMQYEGWQDGTCYGDPMPGAQVAVKKLKEAGFDPYVLTARENRDDVCIWLLRWGFPSMSVTNIKTPAVAYIDDRGLRFTNWPDIVKYFG